MNGSAAAAEVERESCPELSSLEEVPLTLEVSAHVKRCSACRLVVDVFEDVQGDQCMRFDALLAARNDGTLNRAGLNLLERHLASCEDCRAVAETLSPTQDAHGDHATLPKVDPAAYARGLEFARGGMGRILAARDLRVGRPVAVKELLGRSPQLAARFEREARVTARLQHPGIVPIYEIGRWPDDTPFYSMRMVEGSTLRAAIERSSSKQTVQGLAARLAFLPALISACEAVAFAHGQRVIHRDLTPSNILVGEYGETVVIDWGLAKDLLQDGPAEDEPLEGDPYRSEPGDGKLTGAGIVVGTPSYMPPEQARAESVDERADVYALGAILYHLLAGKPPYRAHPSALLDVRAGPPRPIDEVEPRAPRDLISIVDKAMARDPEARYPSARELAQELNRFHTGGMVEAHAYSRRELARRFLRRNRAVVAISTAAIVSLAVLGTVAITRVLASRRELADGFTALLADNGRTELLAGNSQHAFAYLDEAHRRGERSTAMSFMLGRALASVSSSEHVLDCGGLDNRHLAIAPDKQTFAAACRDRARIWHLDMTEVAQLDGGVGDFENIDYSRDSTMVLTWGGGGVARVWDARDGKLLKEFRHKGGVTWASFSPDGSRMTTGGHDGLVRVWEVSSGEQLKLIDARALNSRVYALFAAEGKMIVTISILGEGHGWDPDTGESLGTFQHGSLVYGGQLSPDGRLAATCGDNTMVKLWDVRSGKAVRELAGHTNVVWKCAFNRDGTLLLTTSHDRKAKVWNVATGRPIVDVDHGEIAWTGAFSYDGHMFLTVGVDGIVKVWDLASGALLDAHDSRRGKFALFAPDGRVIALRGDGRVEIWRAPTVRRGALALPEAVAGGGAFAAAAGSDGRVAIYDTHTRKPIDHPPLDRPIAAARGMDRFVAMSGGRAIVFEVLAGRAWPIGEIALPATPSELELSEYGTHLVAMTDRQPPTVWEVRTGKRLGTLDGATHAKLSADGKRAVAWSAKSIGNVRLWSFDGAPPIELANTAGQRGVGFGLDGRRVALARGDRREITKQDECSITLWEADHGFFLREMPNVGDAPSFDPTGRWIATIAMDRTVTVWDVDSAQPRAEFRTDQFEQVQPSPDGQLLSAIGEHGTALLVLATDGRVLARLPFHHDHPIVREEGFLAPAATSWWTIDGTSIVSLSKSVGVWRGLVALERDKLAQARTALPWRVDNNGQLAIVNTGRLRGRAMRGERAVVGARVRIEIRTAPEVGHGGHEWQAFRARSTALYAWTDGDGEFEIEQLVPGIYGVTITPPGGAPWRKDVLVTADGERTVLDLQGP